MKKKVVSLILILTLCVSVLSGCVLFERSNKNDYAQVVARIRNVQIGTEENPELFSKDITKRDLVLAYINFGQSSTEGMTAEDAFDSVLNDLIKKELVLARYQKMEKNGELVRADGKPMLTDARIAQDYNKIWKAVYEYCDQQIDSIESALYAFNGRTAPQKGTAAGEPQYPLYTLADKAREDIQKEIEDEYVPELYTPNALSIPKSSDTFRLDAVKNFIIRMIQQFDEIKLTKAEEALLKADKDFINDSSNKPLIYQKIMGNGLTEKDPATGKEPDGFFCIRRLITQGQVDQIKYERLQDYYDDRVDQVTDADVQRYYAETLESQKIQFNKANSGYLDTYYNAVKDTSGTPFVFYHPTEEVFYVKHILVPFSDAQKAEIEAYGKGNTTEQKTEFRDKTALNIMSYQHENGYDDTAKGLFSLQYIYNDILRSLPRNNHYGAETAFNSLIFKYNTDTGIFNNEIGYIMPPKGKNIASGYMKEFELGAYELYADGKGKPGDFLQKYVITDYGVHLMYYSSNTGRFWENGSGGVVKLSDYTSPLRLQTYARAVKDYILENRQNQSFEFAQNQIADEYRNDDTGKYVKKYAGRYADLLKSVQRAADQAQNAQNAQTQTSGSAS